ncbi:hypothetical protein QYE76_060536 [Lolium multiflorum]|uniref:F-box domain-containing protein n=1 Tax=Lolium multiflorum TaxID=4521 RepID=A0AAD8S094_LOLMU|nr:hypothetical protein QYE76_060536 [Lolium multiflorum]
MAAPPGRRASPAVLPDELVEEILLRLPPDDPACLLRASVVCKSWSSAISHPSFRRRLHELHRTPPVLGFFHNWYEDGGPRFVPTTASSFSLAAPDWRSWRALDCRHGRALFLSKCLDTQEILLWEPITGALQRIPVPAKLARSNAAVLCAVDGCDHRLCLGGPFRVVFVFSGGEDTDEYDDEDYVTSACVYSSETSTWGELTSVPGKYSMWFTHFSSVLVGRSLLYFMSNNEFILEYDLARHGLTLLDTPSTDSSRAYAWAFNLMLAEDGGLGVSEIVDPLLKLWSRGASDGTNARWVLSRVIHLGNLLPIGFLDVDDRLCVEGFAVGANVIFISAAAGLFRIELQTEQVRKVCGDRCIGDCNLIPVVSFYTPHSSLQALRGKQHDLLLPLNPTEDRGGVEAGEEEEKILERAQELFDKGCKAIEDRDFTNAIDCFSHALEIRVSHYGELAPECASTFYRYGHALVCKAPKVKNPSDKVLKSVPNEELVKTTATTSKDDSGSSEPSGCSIEPVLPSEKGETLNGKDQEDVNMARNEVNSDLDLAWKMLDIARAIVAKSPEKTMEKVDIFCALAEVSMKREDRDTAIVYYLEALAILEHLVRPDHFRVIDLNWRICLVFELASKVGDAIPYCAKAISICQSRIQDLKNAKEALLANKDVSASAAEGHSGKLTPEYKISLLSRILARFQKSLKTGASNVNTKLWHS